MTHTKPDQPERQPGPAETGQGAEQDKQPREISRKEVDRQLPADPDPDDPASP